MDYAKYQLGMPCAVFGGKDDVNIKPCHGIGLTDDGPSAHAFATMSNATVVWNDGAAFDELYERICRNLSNVVEGLDTTARAKAAAEEKLAGYVNNKSALRDRLTAEAERCQLVEHFPLGSRLWYVDDVPKGRILVGEVNGVTFHSSSLARYEGQWGPIKYTFRPRPGTQYALYNTAHTKNFFASEAAAVAELEKRFAEETAGSLDRTKVSFVEAQQYLPLEMRECA
jgi:hypothetical protein